MTAEERARRVISHIKPSNTSGGFVGWGGKYKYTCDETADKVLTKEQRDFYEKNGYLIIRANMPHNDLDEWQQHFQLICEEKVERTPTMTVMRDVALKNGRRVGEDSITKLQDWQEDEKLFSYCKHPGVTKYVEAFTGPNIKTIHTMLINKPPDLGGGTSRHPLHQDLYYFPFRPAHKIVCAWTAMERVTPENGCLVIVPGSHTEPLHPHEYPEWEGGVNKAYHGIPKELARMDERVHVIMEKGDTVFFHPLIIHGSGMNKTKGFRKAISCHYASGDCDFVDVAGSVQEKIKNEVEFLAKEKVGVDLSYYDFWKYKSRLIQGTEIPAWQLFGKDAAQLSPIAKYSM